MLEEAEIFLSQDKYLGSLVKKWGKCTLKKTPKHKYFESLIDTICSQQLSGKAAQTIFRRIKSLGKLSPDLIINTTDQLLRDCGLSWSKVSYLNDLAYKVKNKIIDLNSLDRLNDNDVINELIKIKGIGRWSAEMFLIFDLYRPDIFPLDDLGIQKGFEKVVGKKWHKIKSEKFVEKHWKPYRSIAAWYLWRSLENR